MSDRHISTGFDAELQGLSARVLDMGRIAASQVERAIWSLGHLDVGAADQVAQRESRVNQLELEGDEDLARIIARRQPTARDLRFVIGVSKAIGNLERIGDEAARIARVVRRLVEGGGAPTRLRAAAGDASFAASLAVAQLRRALDAFETLDAEAALAVLKGDDAVDDEFDGLMRRLVTHMMEDPRTISASIDLVFVAKAIERVGDHAKNIAEQVIYVARGADVRHSPVEDVASLVG